MIISYNGRISGHIAQYSKKLLNLFIFYCKVIKMKVVTRAEIVARVKKLYIGMSSQH